MEALAYDERLLPAIAAQDMGRTAVKVEDQLFSSAYCL